MKRTVFFLFAVAAVLSFCFPLSAEDEKELLQVVTKPGVGSYIAGSDGHALYYRKKEGKGSAAGVCYQECAPKWGVFCYNKDQIKIGKGLKMSNFRSIRRSDDQDQLIYKDKALYTYNGDINAGDTNGDGVDGEWFLVKP